MGGGGGGGGSTLFLVYSSIAEGWVGVRAIFLCFGGGVLTNFLLEKSGFMPPPPSPGNYCTVPYHSFDQGSRDVRK